MGFSARVGKQTEMERKRDRYSHDERSGLVYVFPWTDGDTNEHDDVGAAPEVDVLWE